MSALNSLDSNILIYAANRTAPKHPKASAARMYK